MQNAWEQNFIRHGQEMLMQLYSLPLSQTKIPLKCLSVNEECFGTKFYQAWQRVVNTLYISPLSQTKMHLKCLSVYIECFQTKFNRVWSGIVNAALQFNLISNKNIPKMSVCLCGTLWIKILQSMTRSCLYDSTVHPNALQNVPKMSVCLCRMLGNKILLGMVRSC